MPDWPCGCVCVLLAVAVLLLAVWLLPSGLAGYCRLLPLRVAALRGEWWLHALHACMAWGLGRGRYAASGLGSRHT